MSVRVLHGDCADLLPTLADASVHAIVTDPPAGIGFMGREWDRDKGGRDAWTGWMRGIAAECLRIAKPGAHALVWALPRTSHWTATAWEDAGWQVKDRICHLFGTGFPKSLNVSKVLTDARCSCDDRNDALPYRHDPTMQELWGGDPTQTASSPGTVLQSSMRARRETASPDYECLRNLPADLGSSKPLPGGKELDMLVGMCAASYFSETKGEAVPSENRAGVSQLRTLRERTSGAPEADCAQREDLLQQVMQGQSVCRSPDPFPGEYEGSKTQRPPVRGSEPCLEGRRDIPEPARELCIGALRAVPSGTDEHVPEGWIRDGAPASDGAQDQATATSDGGCASPGSQPTEQCTRESRTLAVQPDSQTGGAWARCERCGKPRVPDGLGTHLKPAAEDWWLLRKPLAESTVAANVLAHGVGGINVDGCRIETAAGDYASGGVNQHDGTGWGMQARRSEQHDLGRFPANVTHDGSPEVMEVFAAFGEKQSGGVTHQPKRSGYAGFREGRDNGTNIHRAPDTGTAARFFYCAKASERDRAGSKHPTVKNLALMRWLCRLITPPGGTILDPFAGSGTTLQAAIEEGFDVIGIEQEAEYVADIHRRLDTIRAQAPLFA